MYTKMQEMIDQISCILPCTILHMVWVTVLTVFSVIAVGILLQGKDYFLIKRKYGEEGPWYKVIMRKLETTWKCIKILSYPVVPAVGVLYWWKSVLYDNGIHVHRTFEGVATAGWIMGSSVIYSVFTVTVFQLVITKYQDTRKASRREGGHNDFMDLRDEELSPVMYTLVLALSFFFLVGFLVIDYPDALHGGMVVYAVSYMLSLVIFVLTEIDDPFRGVFVIKSIPVELLKVHAKRYRETRNAQALKKFLEDVEAMGSNVYPVSSTKRTTILGLAIFRRRRNPSENGPADAPPS